MEKHVAFVLRMGKSLNHETQNMNEREEWHPPEKGLSQGEGGKMEQEKDLEDVKEELKTEAYD